VAGGPGDDPTRGLDRLELLEPDRVELLGTHVEARIRPDARRVALRAARRGAQAGHLAGDRQVGANGLEIAGVGRPDVPLHRLEDARPVLLPGDRRQRHDRRRLGRSGEEALQLVDRPFGDHAGGGEAHRPSPVQEVDHGLRHGRVRSQAGEQPLQALRRIRLLELDELGQERLVALLLDGPDEIHPGLVVRDLRGRSEVQEVARDPLLPVQRGTRDRVGCGECLVGQGSPGRPTYWSRIVEAVVVALVAIDRGERRVELERAFPGARREGGEVGRCGHAG